MTRKRIIVGNPRATSQPEFGMHWPLVGSLTIDCWNLFVEGDRERAGPPARLFSPDSSSFGAKLCFTLSLVVCVVSSQIPTAAVRCCYSFVSFCFYSPCFALCAPLPSPIQLVAGARPFSSRPHFPH